MSPRVTLDQKKLAALCRRYHVRKLSLFGSVLTERFGPESDVDVLVEFEPEQGLGYLGLAHMQRELSEIIGRKVDLRTPLELSRYFRDEVIANAQVQYSAA